MIQILITDIDGVELKLSDKVQLLDETSNKFENPCPIRLAPTDTGFEVQVLADNKTRVTLMRNTHSRKFRIVKEK